MPDDIDHLQARLEFEQNVNVYQSKKPEPAVKQPVGYCLNCGAPLENARWCNADCRDLWQELEDNNFL